jgi:hypothetical protein
MEVWQVMLLLEIATVIIEVLIIGLVWKLKGGKLRWYWLLALVGIANAVTAWMGVFVYESLKNDLYDGVYYFSSGYSGYPNVVVGMVFATAITVVVGLIVLYRLTPSEKPNRS